MMKKDPYTTFLGAKAVAFAWIGSIIGPLFMLVGLMDFEKPHFYIGLLFLIIVILTVRDGFKARRHGKSSDFIAMSIVPMLMPFACLTWFCLSL